MKPDPKSTGSAFMAPSRNCLNPNCTRKAAHRGLCLSCYQTARRLVTQKRVTWQELEQRGKCLKSKRKGRSIEWLLQP